MENVWIKRELIETLKKGGIAVMPTDTIYGLVGKALDKDVVNRIYEVRRRNPDKPCIILIGEESQIKDFSIFLNPIQEKKLKEFWPGPVSIVLDCLDEKFEYLHRGTNTLAFRLPKDQSFRDFLNEVGPLIAPSANPEGYPYSKDIDEAQGYFGNAVDYYLDTGFLEGKPSKVVRLQGDSTVSILRE